MLPSEINNDTDAGKVSTFPYNSNTAAEAAITPNKLPQTLLAAPVYAFGEGLVGLPFPAP